MLTYRKTKSVLVYSDKKKEIYIKDETSQVSGAFKYRGVFNKISNENVDQFNGIVTASTGNHGTSVAIAAEAFGKNGVIVVPKRTPLRKKNNIAKHGASLIDDLFDTYDECMKYAIQFASDNNYLYIPSFDDELIIEGHKSLFEECIAEYGEGFFDRCYCPIGGGGLISAASSYKNSLFKNLTGVEVEKYDAMNVSLKEGELTKISLEGSEKSLCEGLLVQKVGALPYSIAKKNNLFVQTVSENEVKRAIKFLAQYHIMAEGAGAAALAVALRENFSGKALCIVSGGNINIEEFESIINSDNI